MANPQNGDKSKLVYFRKRYLQEVNVKEAYRKNLTWIIHLTLKWHLFKISEKTRIYDKEKSEQ